MDGGAKLTKSTHVDMLQSPLMLRANPERVVILPFAIASSARDSAKGAIRVVILPFAIASSARDSAKGAMSRVTRICDAIIDLSAEEVRSVMEEVNRDFTGRHWQTRGIFLERFNQIQAINGGMEAIDEDHRALIGAYFSHEYSYQAAAVMNPSIVVHPDQTGAGNGSVNFILSTRTVGEGHISTISFREGVFHADGSIELKPETDFAVAAKPKEPLPYDGAVTAPSQRSPCPTMAP